MASAVAQLPDRSHAVSAPPVPWAALAWFGALLIAAYFPVLRHLGEQWSTDEDVSHGFFEPLVAGFIACQLREQALALHPNPPWCAFARLPRPAPHVHPRTL